MTTDSLARKLFFKYAQGQTLLSPSMPGGSNVSIPKAGPVPVELINKLPHSEKAPDSSPATPMLDQVPENDRITINPETNQIPAWKADLLQVIDNLYFTNVLAPHYYREVQGKAKEILNEDETGALKKELDVAAEKAEKHALVYALKIKKIRSALKL